MSRRPPKFILLFFKPFIKTWVLEDIEGDLNELYTERLSKKGRLRADLGYFLDLITMLNLYRTKYNFVQNTRALFLHHVKSSIRGFQKRKEYFFINTAGLVLALSATVLIALHVIQELSFDNFHSNGNRIVRLTMNNTLVTSARMGPHLQELFPEIEAASRVNLPHQPIRFKVGQTVFGIDRLAYVDSGFFKIFDFPIVKSTSADFLSTSNQIAISESEAFKLFGYEEPLGSLITINDSLQVEVSAVFKDVPRNSHLQFDYLLPTEFRRRMGHGRFLDLWGMFNSYNYFLLSDEKAATATSKKVDQEIKRLFEEFGTQPEMNFQALDEIHFNSQYSGDVSNQGDWGLVRIYIAAGLLVFVIACINYINLSAAIISRRAREIGIRKVLGANRANLLKQYLTEVVLLACFSFLLSLIIVQAFVPYFNQHLGHDLVFSVLNPSQEVLLIFLVYVLVTIVLAGVYPAYLFSSLAPIDALHGEVHRGKKGFRRVLVILQFCFSLILLILTFITKNQIRFIVDFDPGYDRERVIVMPLYGHPHNEFQTMKTELLRSSLIESVSAAGSMPIYNETSSPSANLEWTGKEQGPDFRINLNWVEDSFLELFDIKVVDGKGFVDFPGNSETLLLLNQAAVDVMGIEDPIGIEMSIWGENGHVIGITEDYNFKSVKNSIEPMLMILERQYYEYAFIKYKEGAPQEAIGLIEETARKVDPNYASNLTFLDSEFQDMYEAEQRTNALLSIFSFLAIVISSMGLFGFITFVVQLRLKEVSIRKVLGASTGQLAAIISNEFLVMQGVACLISWPIALLTARSWLSNFEYRISIDAFLFLSASGFLLVVTLLVVGVQLVKVIRVNPSKILRRE